MAFPPLNNNKKDAILKHSDFESTAMRHTLVPAAGPSMAQFRLSESLSPTSLGSDPSSGEHRPGAGRRSALAERPGGAPLPGCGEQCEIDMPALARKAKPANFEDSHDR